MKATIDGRGLPTGFYTASVHGKGIPKGAVEIPKADYKAHINGDLRCCPDGINWLKYEPMFDPLDAAAARKQIIAADCRAAITAGISCNALGAAHTYPTSERDQANLAAQVLAAQISGVAGEPYKLWCADAAGEWERRPHTAARIIQVGEAVRRHVAACQDQYETLIGQLDALAARSTTTKADIDAVAWQ